ncbi:LuxR family transcriptional regulator [Massilia forsythiae]|uniref:LuxR family transcriptional regulator n=1 Tax=Massilia forsythiae TaxID=2728020 RepID=A0A7Z2VYK8_9BURK|nr:autoinducer binding domain-containing protein [Massilia forsythiae]QJE01533.1 LuxR family transcriptional regulator [Massilia forsythiae]
MNLFDWQQTVLHDLLGAPNEATFFKVLSRAASELGFDYCAYGMRMPLPLSNPKVFMLNNYSTEWQARYVSQNYVAIDPTVAHGSRSILPLMWSEEVFDNCRPFWEEAREHGLEVGWAQSSYDARGIGGLLTLARSGEPISESEMGANSMRMSWLVQVAHEGMRRLHTSTVPAMKSPLTTREVEVLRWTADGKTSSEVGQIMNITERTVNFHVNNSLEKLGAVNKTACVIKAAMLRLL